MNALEPFTGDWTQILFWYIVVVTLMFGIAYLVKDIDWFENNLTDTSAIKLVVGGILIAPWAEEIAFRAIPLLLFGSPLAVALGTVVWILAHGKRSIIIAPSGFLYYMLWTSGLGIEAIVLHFLHNLFFVSLTLIGRRRKMKKDSISPRSIDL